MDCRSLLSIVSCLLRAPILALQVTCLVLSILLYAVETHTTGNSRWWASKMKSVEVMEGQHKGMDRPVTVVVAAHRRRQKSTGKSTVEASVGVVPPMTPLRHGNLVS